MFQTWSYNDGLGQTKSCQEIVQEQLARGYVFAGTALAWSGKGNAKDNYFTFAGLNKAKLEAAIGAGLEAGNFYAIRVDTETPLLSTQSTGTKVRIWATAPSDFGNLNDVKNLISGVVADHMTNVQDVTISVREIPPMCTGSPIAPAPGTQAPTTPAPGTPQPGAGKCADKTGLESIACELGLITTGDILQWLIIGVIGVVVIKTVMK